MIPTPKPPRATIKPKRCKWCRHDFFPTRPMQKVCSPACAHAYANHEAAKKAAKAKALEAKQDRAKRIALKTIPQLKKEAQIAFNQFIRARDRLAGHSCICCGRPLDWGRLGGAVDAGHYRSTGSADHLRFHEDNCHAQRSDCNRYGAGRAVDYRIGLLSRIGRERVEALECSNEAIKWTRSGLIEIKSEYRRKLKELQSVERDDASLLACV